MTRNELGVIRARAEAATKGPWTIHRHQKGHELAWVDSYYCTSDAVEAWFPEYRYHQGHNGVVFALESRMYLGDEAPWKEEDREFCQHARTDVELLLDEVERLRAKLGEGVKVLEGVG